MMAAIAQWFRGLIGLESSDEDATQVDNTEKESEYAKQLAKLRSAIETRRSRRTLKDVRSSIDSADELMKDALNG